MKKSLLTVALLGATTAMAQNSVQIYGTVDYGFSNLDSKLTSPILEDPLKIKQYGISPSHSASSFIGFKGTEDLGNGNKAGFTIEIPLNPSDDDFNLRQAFVFVGNSDAQLTIGRQYSFAHKLLSDTSLSLGSNIVGDGIRSVNNISPLGIDAYGAKEEGIQLVGKIDNLFLGVAYGEQKAKGESNEYSGSLKDKRYAFTAIYKDPEGFTGGYVYQVSPAKMGVNAEFIKSLELENIDADSIAESYSAETKAKSHIVSANYKLGNFTPYASYIRQSFEGDSEDGGGNRNQWALGAAYQITPALRTFVTYTDGNYKLTDGDYTLKTDVNGIQTGVHYALSKRTNVYALYGQRKHENEFLTFKEKQYAAGIKHSF